MIRRYPRHILKKSTRTLAVTVKTLKTITILGQDFTEADARVLLNDITEALAA